MSFFTPIYAKIKSYNYSIITAVVIVALISIYLLIIIPNNENSEDANNLASFRGTEKQLQLFFEDKLKEIGPEKKDSLTHKHLELKENSVYIDKIELDSLIQLPGADKKLLMIRKIYFKKINTNKALDPIKDKVQFSIDEFVKRLNNNSSFKSFFICPVTNSKDSNLNGKCLSQNILISQNISLKDEDSLSIYNRNNGLIEFKKSSNRYYTGQVKIPDSNFTLFVAAGIPMTYFKSIVHYISPNLLMFGLSIIGVLLLSICFMKPVVSSYKERLSQKDLITVVFSTGALIALFVVLGMVIFWKSTIANRTESDLKYLVDKIDTSFKNEIKSLQNWRLNYIPKNLNRSQFPFRKLYLEKGSIVSLTDGDSIVSKNKFVKKDTVLIWNANNFNTMAVSEQIQLIDSYFWMDKEGLLTASISKDNTTFARKYNDRKYFKLLQKNGIDTVLTGVFSRETDEYQWIYAQKDEPVSKDKKPKKSAIKGIAFREHFSKQFQLPPDTQYMLVDREGSVLMQNKGDKNLYVNLLTATDNNASIISLLSGCPVTGFSMDFRGDSYQVYAKRLDVPMDLPVYILAMRKQSYIDYLSLFTFSNAFLFTVLYSLLIAFLILLYSHLFYQGRLSFLSRYHFYHLFPDNSRKEEYEFLIKTKVICFLVVIGVYFFASPILSVYFCLLMGVNITFVHVIVLNTRSSQFIIPFTKFYLLVLFLGVIFPLGLFLLGQICLSLLFLFGSHLALILYYRNWKNWETHTASVLLADAAKKNNGVHRKLYLRFLTSGLFSYFILFPFILVSAIYTTEINDYVRFYCSPPLVPVNSSQSISFTSYGCECHKQSKSSVSKNEGDGLIHQFNFGFDTPTWSEISDFSFITLNRDTYMYMNHIFLQIGLNMLCFLLCFILLLFLIYGLLNYYSNHFFFFDLMQASKDGFYPGKEEELKEDYDYLTIINVNAIPLLIQQSLKGDNFVLADKVDSDNFPLRTSQSIATVFDSFKNAEIPDYYKKEFVLESNLKKYESIYASVWDSIQCEDTKNVLFDFAQDHFVNYKNKDKLQDLMDLGLVNHDIITGRLKLMNYSFRKYVLSKEKKDPVFVEKFEKESKNGSFEKFKIPVLIIVISLLVLLMYLNKDSYEKISILGSSIAAALVLINKFLVFDKN